MLKKIETQIIKKSVNKKTKGLKQESQNLLISPITKGEELLSIIPIHYLATVNSNHKYILKNPCQCQFITVRLIENVTFRNIHIAKYLLPSIMKRKKT